MLLLIVIIIINASLYHISPLPFLTNGHLVVMVPRLQSQEYPSQKGIQTWQRSSLPKSPSLRGTFSQSFVLSYAFQPFFLKIKPKIRPCRKLVDFVGNALTVTNPTSEKFGWKIHRCEQDLLKRIDGVAGSSSLWSLKLFSKIQDTQAV